MAQYHCLTSGSAGKEVAVHMAPLRGFCSEPFFGRKSYFHCVCTILISISKESIFYVPSDR